MSAPQTQGTTPAGRPARLYISYSHRDRKLLDRFLTHLEPLQKERLIEVFYDRVLGAGEKWDEGLLRQLSESSIVLFLVSADSLASSFIEREMHAALSQQESTRIVPVILRPCAWTGSPLGRFMALPRDARPVATWKDRNEAWASVIEGIRSVLASLTHGEDQRMLPSRHAAAVRRIAITPDGRWAVSASDDCTAIVWDLSSMQPAAVLTGHEDAVTDVEVSLDGKRAITISRTSVRMWDAQRWRELSAVVGTSGGLMAVAAADGAIITASLSQIIVWRGVGDELFQHLTATSADVTDVVADIGQRFLSVHRDGRCRIWMYELSGPLMRMVLELSIAKSPVREVRTLPGADSTYVTCCENGSIQVFSPGKFSREFTISSAAISGIAPLPDGRHGVAACAGGSLKLCDFATGAVVREVPMVGDPPTAVAITPDGTRAIWGSATGRFGTWALDTVVRQPLPEGRDRLKLAYLAVLEQPGLWRVLETFDESTLSGIGAQLSLPPDTDVLKYLADTHPGVEPPPLWSAWMETLQPGKLGKTPR